METELKFEEVQKAYQEKFLSHQETRAAFNERYIENINEYNHLPHPILIHRNDVPRELEVKHILEGKPNKSL